MTEEIQLAKTAGGRATAADPWSRVMYLACRLAVEIPAVHFTVSDLLNLEPGSLVESGLREGNPVPVLINAQPLAWAEFDFVDGRLAVRLTELI